MKNHWKLWCIFFIAGIGIDTGAQTITAVSNPFTFPPITAIKPSRNTGHPVSYFTCSTISSRLAGVRLAWSFPAQPQYQKGSIVIYSPLGRLLKKFSISANTGTVALGAGRELGMGVYIAKITCGASNQSLKFLICR